VTDFADSGVVVPIAAAVFALLLVLGLIRNAVVWALAVGTILGTMVLLKLTLSNCMPPSPLAPWHSPSGHTASAAMVYGGLAAVLGWGVFPTFAQSLAVAGLIGTSRFLLAMHSVPEAALGGGIGLFGATVLATSWRAPERRQQRRALAILVPLVVVVLACLLHGVHWQAEQAIRRASSRFWPLQACGS